MNKQMTPAEIELVQNRLGRLALLWDKAGLAGIEAGPLPKALHISAAIALASMTMK
jgi:hypothetical protein